MPVGFQEIAQVRSIGGRPRPTEHIVHFYEEEPYFLGELTAYVTDGLSAGEATILIATPDHLAAVEETLRLRGVDLAEARTAGTYITADAASTLARFMGLVSPDATRFEAVIEDLIVKAMGPDGRRPVRAFGEMVALLCRRGQYSAALELESLWSVAARRLSFSLLCAYPVGLFREERPGASLRQTAATHDTVIRSGRHAPLLGDLEGPLD
jgi:hypothetical protein